MILSESSIKKLIRRLAVNEIKGYTVASSRPRFGRGRVGDCRLAPLDSSIEWSSTKGEMYAAYDGVLDGPLEGKELWVRKPKTYTWQNRSNTIDGLKPAAVSVIAKLWETAKAEGIHTDNITIEHGYQDEKEMFSIVKHLYKESTPDDVSSGPASKAAADAAAREAFFRVYGKSQNVEKIALLCGKGDDPDAEKEIKKILKKKISAYQTGFSFSLEQYGSIEKILEEMLVKYPNAYRIIKRTKGHPHLHICVLEGIGDVQVGKTASEVETERQANIKKGTVIDKYYCAGDAASALNHKFEFDMQKFKGHSLAGVEIKYKGFKVDYQGNKQAAAEEWTFMGANGPMNPDGTYTKVNLKIRAPSYARMSSEDKDKVKSGQMPSFLEAGSADGSVIVFGVTPVGQVYRPQLDEYPSMNVQSRSEFTSKRSIHDQYVTDGPITKEDIGSSRAYEAAPIAEIARYMYGLAISKWNPSMFGDKETSPAPGSSTTSPATQSSSSAYRATDARMDAKMGVYESTNSNKNKLLSKKMPKNKIRIDEVQLRKLIKRIITENTDGVEEVYSYHPGGRSRSDGYLYAKIDGQWHAKKDDGRNRNWASMAKFPDSITRIEDGMDSDKTRLVKPEADTSEDPPAAAPTPSPASSDDTSAADSSSSTSDAEADETEYVHKKGTKLKPDKFKSIYGPMMAEATAGTPLFASVKLAQMALETGWGRHTIGEANNLFGIKAKGSPNQYWDGSKVYAGTEEVYDGKRGKYTLAFRKYDSYEDSIMDHNRLLLQASRYQRVREATTPEEQARMLKACGYATGERYAETLISILTKYDFKVFDEDKNQSFV